MRRIVHPLLLRRLLGAAVLLLALFVLSLLLPPPTDPRQASEPDLHRIEVAVDDPRPVENPVQAAPAPEDEASDAAAPSRDAASRATPPPRATSTLRTPSADAPLPPPEAIEDDDAAAAPDVPSQIEAERREREDAAATPMKPAPKLPVPKPETPRPEAARPTPPPASAAAKPAPSVPARPTVTPPSAVVAPPPPAATTPKAAPPASAPTSPAPKPAAGRWYVQAGSYADMANARQVEAQLKSLGYGASVSLIEAGGSARYRVRCGPFAARETADAAKQRIEQNRIPAGVVPGG